MAHDTSNSLVEEGLWSGFEKILQARTDDGQPRYSSEMIEDFTVLGLLNGIAREPDFNVPPDIERRVHEFGVRIGVPAEATPAEASAHTRAYFEAHPLDETLLASVGRLVREMAQEFRLEPNDRSKKALQFLGIASPSPPASGSEDNEQRMSPLDVFGLRNKPVAAGTNSEPGPAPRGMRKQ